MHPLALNHDVAHGQLAGRAEVSARDGGGRLRTRQQVPDRFVPTEPPRRRDPHPHIGVVQIGDHIAHGDTVHPAVQQLHRVARNPLRRRRGMRRQQRRLIPASLIEKRPRRPVSSSVVAPNVTYPILTYPYPNPPRTRGGNPFPPLSTGRLGGGTPTLKYDSHARFLPANSTSFAQAGILSPYLNAGSTELWRQRYGIP
jgi:hypothetical protein